MPIIEINNLKIFYEIHGEGPNLVLIGGLSSNINFWNPKFLKEISKHFKTIIFSKRGTGRTDNPKMDYTIKLFATDTVKLMDALGIEKAFVLGHSMGGMIAQEMVLNYPKKVERLILCSTSCGGKKQIISFNNMLKIALLNLIPSNLYEKKMKYLNEEFFTDEFMRNNPTIINNFIKRRAIWSKSRFNFFLQFSAALRHNAVNRLKKIETHTLLLHGTRDIVVPPQEWDNFK